MNKTILTEKPSVARDIAKVIGADENKGGWLEGCGADGVRYFVTWCYGHLLEMYAPEGDGRWNIDELPLLPKGFLLRPIPDADVKSKSGNAEPMKEQQKKKSDSETRIDVIRSLFGRSDEIIAATDAGREGQAIFENVYEYIGITRPVKRLWISSLTESAIAEGMRHLIDNGSDDMRNLGIAARQRAMADWLVGVNATRAFTLTAAYHDAAGKKRILSLGRVQTSTLKIICDRYEENVNFKSEPYWYITGKSIKDGVTFGWRGEERYTDRNEGMIDKTIVESGKVLTVRKVNTERKNEQPPLLHDIASLQKIANSRYGFTMERTLAIAQKLYEAHLITYPRTGSRYIPHDVFKTIPALIKNITSDKYYGGIATDMLNSGTLNSRSVNDGKITDHHALLITDKRPGEGLGEEESKIYDLVLMRVLEAFAPACIADVTNVELTGGDGIVFTTKGRKEVVSGWRSVGKVGTFESAVLADSDEIELSMMPLPVMREGERIPISAITLQEDKTKPKPLYTDATLLTAMESAGRRSDDKKVVEALREIGIGTPATRSEIMALLVRRGYIVRDKKRISPTTVGLMVYRAVKDLELANVEMTASWEMALDDIKEGKGDVRGFEDGIRGYVRRVVKEIKSSEGVNKVREAMEADVLKCPKCGAPLKIYEKSAWCRQCKFTMWRTYAGKTLSESSMEMLIKKKYTGVLTGFKNKAGKEFSASLEMTGIDDKNVAQVEMRFEKKFNK